MPPTCKRRPGGGGVAVHSLAGNGLQLSPPRTRNKGNLCEGARPGQTLMVEAWSLDAVLHRPGQLGDVARLVVERAFCTARGRPMPSGSECLICTQPWALGRPPVAIVVAVPFTNPEQTIVGGLCEACADRRVLRTRLIAVLEEFYRFKATDVRTVHAEGHA